MDLHPHLAWAEDDGFLRGAIPADGSILHQLDTLETPNGEPESHYSVVREEMMVLKSSNLDLSPSVKEVTEQDDSFRVKDIEGEAYANLEERLKLEVMVEVYRAKLLELSAEKSLINGVIVGIEEYIRLAKDCLIRIAERTSDEKLEKEYEEENSDSDDGLNALFFKSRFISKLGVAVETKFLELEAMRKKEKSELENRILSLQEENRDVHSLLRAALAEKEAADKSLQKLKENSEQKRGAILQIAERGLQKVGFGYVMGMMGVETQSEQPGSSASSIQSDSSECEEEITSLASTVDIIMKDLRQEISVLRRDLQECRSENQDLRTFLDTQNQKMKDHQSYIRDLEDRENMLSNSVKELMLETKDAADEVLRWREACELEVAAGKVAITEREKEVDLLRAELERTKASLDAANSKVSLKEKLADTAMAAQAAAEATLRLADNRSAMFRQCIEELTKQLEDEVECDRKERGRDRRRARRVCWPWQALRVTSPAASWSSSGRGQRRLGSWNDSRDGGTDACRHLRLLWFENA